MGAKGQAMTQDDGKAWQIHAKAAAQGEAKAQNTLGLLYEDGLGIEQDYVRAREWFEKAENNT